MIQQLPISYSITNEFREADVWPDVPAGARLEAFCDHIGERFNRREWMGLATETLIEEIAREFRAFFNLRVPVLPQIENLLRELDIERIVRDDAGRKPGVDCPLPCGPWQVHLPDNLGMTQSLRTLQAVFEVIFWRCQYRVRWWRQWREASAIAGPGRWASCFAYLVALPPGDVKRTARRCGLNIWRMADELMATPSACFYGLRRYARFEHPYFLARLNFAISLDQQQLFFEEGSVRAKVWAKFLARAGSVEPVHSNALDTLSQFPKQGSIIEVKGFLLNVIRSRQPLIWTSDKIMGLSLPKPVAFTARPSRDGTQLLLQSVPAGCHQFLLDDALLIQQELARTRKPTLP